jgi:hypothetical protein
MRLLVTLLVVFGLLVPVQGSAQRQRMWSVDVTIGRAIANKSPAYQETSHVLAEGLLAIRWSRAAGHSFIAAAGLSGDPISSEDVACGGLPNDFCLPFLPSFTSGHVLAGWEALSASDASLRIMAGPVIHRFRNYEPRSGGFQVRMDVASPRMGRMGAVLSTRWTHVRSYRDTRVDYRSISFGLRVR